MEPNDEILKGYSIAEFLKSPKCAGWNPDTRRRYGGCLHDLLEFTAQHGQPTRELLDQWQRRLEQTYTRTAVNVHLSAANNYFRWCGRLDLLRGHARKEEEQAERQTPALTRSEYLKLLRAARTLGRRRTYLLVKLFANTDLPLQCLDQVTAELVQRGQGMLDHRGGPVRFRCPASLQREILEYMAFNGIYHGPVFVTRSGQPLDRIGIFRALRELCQAAGVPEEKGNPRALRNLYRMTQKSIEDRLAVLKEQMYDQILDMEQDAVGWRPDGPADRNRTA